MIMITILWLRLWLWRWYDYDCNARLQSAIDWFAEAAEHRIQESSLQTHICNGTRLIKD